MTWRSDSSQLFAGKWTSSLYAGHGVQAQDVPSTGTSGASFLFNDIAAQGMAATDEVRGELLTWPSAGTLTVNEDSSFSFAGAPDGAYSFTYRGFRNGVSYGDYTASLTIGGESTVSAVGYGVGSFGFAVEQSFTAPSGSAAVGYDIGSFTFAATADFQSAAVNISVNFDISAFGFTIYSGLDTGDYTPPVAKVYFLRGSNAITFKR